MISRVMMLLAIWGLLLNPFISSLGPYAMAQDRVQELSDRVKELEQQGIQEDGRRLYRQACATCHGVGGDGHGPSASGLNPRPHDFTTGMYKFRTTLLNAAPTDADLVRTIREGIPGTAMPAWKHLLSASQQRALALYLKTFAPDAFAQRPNAVEGFPLPPAPDATPERVQRGRSLYERLQCAQCHGPNGRGDGPLAKQLRDAWDRPIPPANLTRGIYKSGTRPEDLFRTLWTGLAGTPMPAWSGAMSIEEGWDLVHYIRSLSQPKSLWQRLFVETGEDYPGR